MTLLVACIISAGFTIPIGWRFVRVDVSPADRGRLEAARGSEWPNQRS